jgi:hypothetical protein
MDAEAARIKAWSNLGLVCSAASTPGHCIGPMWRALGAPETRSRFRGCAPFEVPRSSTPVATPKASRSWTGRCAARRSTRTPARVHWIGFRPWPESLRAEAALRCGQLDRADQMFQKAYALARNFEYSPCWESAAGRGLGLVAAANGAVDRAVSWLDDAYGRCAGLRHIPMGAPQRAGLPVRTGHRQRHVGSTSLVGRVSRSRRAGSACTAFSPAASSTAKTSAGTPRVPPPEPNTSPRATG